MSVILSVIGFVMFIYAFYCLTAIKDNTYWTKKVLDEILEEIKKMNDSKEQSEKGS